jgi:hypothetical protein
VSGTTGTTGTTGTRPAPSRGALSAAVYGVVSIAVVIVASEGDAARWDIVELIAGYVILIWVTHIYADVVSAGTEGSWIRSARHEAPVAIAGLPALATATAGATLNWPPGRTATVALVACVVALLYVQAMTLRSSTSTRAHLIRTVVVDLVSAAMIVGLQVVTKH